MIDHGTGIVIGETTIIKVCEYLSRCYFGALQVERACKKNAILQLRIMLFMPMQRF
jgi:hypothetical protein